MPLHIETELADAKARAKRQAGIVAQRKAFLGELPEAGSDEAMKLHGVVLKDEERILGEIRQQVTAMEKAISDMKAPAKPAQETPTE